MSMKDTMHFSYRAPQKKVGPERNRSGFLYEDPLSNPSDKSHFPDPPFLFSGLFIDRAKVGKSEEEKEEAR